MHYESALLQGVAVPAGWRVGVRCALGVRECKVTLSVHVDNMLLCAEAEHSVAARAAMDRFGRDYSSATVEESFADPPDPAAVEAWFAAVRLWLGTVFSGHHT